jgi:hypothetical protein
VIASLNPPIKVVVKVFLSIFIMQSWSISILWHSKSVTSCNTSVWIVSLGIFCGLHGEIHKKLYSLVDGQIGETRVFS